MAQKRKVTNEVHLQFPDQQIEETLRAPLEKPAKGLEEESDLPLWMQEQSWSEWFKRVLASRLYVLACFAIDVFLGLDLADRFGNDAWIVLPIIALLIAVQATIYLYLWGSEGRLR
jgi:hypothetical protein